MFTNIDRDLLHLILAGMIWLIVVACAVSSVFTQPELDQRTRRFWLYMILGIPLLGLLIYIPFSLDKPKILREWFAKLLPGKSA